MLLKKKTNTMNAQALIAFLFVLHGLSPVCCSKINNFRGLDIGINFGRLGSNLPPPEKVASLIKSLSINHVKTFDTDPLVTQAFQNTNISLSLCVPDQNIPAIAFNQSEADIFIQTFILPYHKKTKINLISIGNEVSMLPDFNSYLLLAMENVYTSLKRFRLHQKISVSTTHSLAVLAVTFPPSAACFQESIAQSLLVPMFKFLKRTKSPIMVNVYPYLTYKDFPAIPVEFCLFQGSKTRIKFTDLHNGLVYTNLFDVLVDAVNSAAFSLGFRDLSLVVAETGWPTEGDSSDSAASVRNAAIYTQRLIQHVTAMPIKGTPLRPRTRIPTYIFSLFDEDQKWGAASEKHWGVLYANGTKKYKLEYSGKSRVPYRS